MESYKFVLESAPNSGENCEIVVTINNIEYQPNHDDVAADIYDALAARTDFNGATKTVDTTTAFTS